jgi:serine O-acetyltransferase
MKNYRREPLLSSLITRAVISHPSFAAAIAASLSRAFKGDIAEDDLLTVMAATIDKPYELDGPSVADTCFSDLFAITLRDPACEGLVHAFLNFKGFKALASHRIAHVLWCDGRKEVALSIQARCTELFAVDIHPAAKIGAGNDAASP